MIEILAGIATSTPECAALFAPGGRLLREGDVFRNPELGDALERLGREGAAPFYTGDIAAAVVDWLEGAGSDADGARTSRPTGSSTASRCACLPRARRAHQPAAVRRRHADRLRARAARARAGPPTPARLVDVMEAAQAERTPEFLDGLAEAGFLERFLASRLGSTTHISVLDVDGWAARRDLLQRRGLGHRRPGHRHAPQQHARRAGPQPARLPPPPARAADAEHDGPDDRARRRRARSSCSGAAGPTASARRSSRRSSTCSIGDGRGRGGPRAAAALRGRRRLRRAGRRHRRARGAGAARIARFRDLNLFFGGVHAVARDPATGELSGGGDPRRGGSVAVA